MARLPGLACGAGIGGDLLAAEGDGEKTRAMAARPMGAGLSLVAEMASPCQIRWRDTEPRGTRARRGRPSRIPPRTGSANPPNLCRMGGTFLPMGQGRAQSHGSGESQGLAGLAGLGPEGQFLHSEAGAERPLLLFPRCLRPGRSRSPGNDAAHAEADAGGAEPGRSRGGARGAALEMPTRGGTAVWGRPAAERVAEPQDQGCGRGASAGHGARREG